jgi:hypothetical protein
MERQSLNISVADTASEVRGAKSGERLRYRRSLNCPSSMKHSVLDYELGELNYESSKLGIFFHERADVSFVGICLFNVASDW